MKKFLNRRNIFVIVIVLLYIPVTYFLQQQSFERTLFISFTLFLWLSIFLYTKDLVLSSLLYILIVLPFNITLQLPTGVEIFNTSMSFPSPFVNGMYSNYLVPTLSIVDVGVFLFLISVLVENGFKYIWKILRDLKNGFLIFIIYLIIQNIFLNNSFTIFSSIRFIFYLLTLLLLINYCKEKPIEKILLPSSFILLFNLIIQGVIGVLQFLRGASLGLVYLGESQVVSGMQGSSFIDLGGRLFLRAYGTFPHPNVLGGFLVLCILFGILSAKKIPGIGISLVILSLIFLLFTFSRIAIVVSILILLLLLLKTILNVKNKVLSVTPLLLLERFSNLFNGRDSGWRDRVELLRSSWEVLKDNYILGTGIGNYVRGMEDYIPITSGGISLIQPVHNIFVLLLVELGVFGFLIYFYILFRLLIKNIGKFTIFKLMVIISVLGIGFWDHFLISLPQGLMMFVLMFVLLVVDFKFKETI